MTKILDLKLDEKTGVLILRLSEGMLSGMSLFLSGFLFSHLKNGVIIFASQGCYDE